MSRIKRLSEFSDHEMVGVISSEVMGENPIGDAVDVVAKAVASVAGATVGDDHKLLKKRMSQYIGMLRGMQLWYHAAHHVTRGTGFFGDHADLYGTLYKNLTEDFDQAVEKAIGLTNDEDMANPCNITEVALCVLHKFPCPPTLSALALASTALELENSHNKLVSAMFDELESAGCLTLGLNDMLMATVNAHEEYYYKLQQRVKTELEN